MLSLWNRGFLHPLAAVSLCSFATKCAAVGIQKTYMQQRRTFASSSRPRPLAIPFRIGMEEAKHACEHKFKGWLSPSYFLDHAKFTLTKQYIPFYAFDVTFNATVECTWEQQVSKDRRVRMYETIVFKNQHLPFTHPHAQLLATFYHRRAFAERLCGSNFGDLQPLDTLVKGDEEILPITVDNRYATHIALPNKLQQWCHNNARERCGNSTARTTVTFFQILSTERRSVWAPAYVSEFTRFGQPFVDLVCGYTGHVMGPPHFDGLKVGVLSTGVIFIAVRLGLVAVSLPLNLVISGCVGVFAHYFPLLSKWWADRRHSNEAAEHHHYVRTHGELPGMGPDGFFEEQQEEFEEQQFRRQRGRRTYERHQTERPSSYAHLDPVWVNNCKLIGLDPARSHTVLEIKTAFRRTALKVHPDKATDAEGKRRAEEHFKKVTHAYNQLLNKHKQSSA